MHRGRGGEKTDHSGPAVCLVYALSPGSNGNRTCKTQSSTKKTGRRPREGRSAAKKPTQTDLEEKHAWVLGREVVERGRDRLARPAPIFVFWGRRARQKSSAARRERARRRARANPRRCNCACVRATNTPPALSHQDAEKSMMTGLPALPKLPPLTDSSCASYSAALCTSVTRPPAMVVGVEL